MKPAIAIKKPGTPAPTIGPGTGNAPISSDLAKVRPHGAKLDGHRPF
jgi:hypothetical protein